MRAITSLALSLLLAAGLSACSGSTTTSPSAATTTTTATSPTSESFASQLSLRGSTSRSFKMTTAGTVKVTLTGLGDGSRTAGLGVGVLGVSALCGLAQSVVTGPGDSPQIVTSADAGTYCVELFDAGDLTEDTPFAITVEHP